MTRQLVMRIFLYEFASGGGLAGARVPRALATEGRAMLAAVAADLAALGRHRIVTTVDARIRPSMPPGVGVVAVGDGGGRAFDALVTWADAVWLIAPETDRQLERLAARVTRRGRALLGSGAAAIRRAADKANLPARLLRRGVMHPATRVLPAGADPRPAARELGYPLVIKPARGAGCEGVSIARNGHDLRVSVGAARRVAGAGPLVLQRYVRGTPASVSLLSNGRRAVPLCVNAQHVRTSPRVAYAGGQTPLDHPLAGEAARAAVRACEAFPGLCGYVGIDLVLTDAEAVVIEVNPRLTTAYIGVRAALDRNIAGLALAACAGALPEACAPRRRVRFTASGRLDAAEPLRRSPS